MEKYAKEINLLLGIVCFLLAIFCFLVGAGLTAFLTYAIFYTDNGAMSGLILPFALMITAGGTVPYRLGKNFMSAVKQ